MQFLAGDVFDMPKQWMQIIHFEQYLVTQFN